MARVHTYRQNTHTHEISKKKKKIKKKETEGERDQAQSGIAGNGQPGLWTLHLEMAMACLVASAIPFGLLPGSIYPFIPCFVHTEPEDPLSKAPT